MSKKNLHKHSLPIVLLLIVGLAASALCYTAYQSKTTLATLRAGLTAHTITVTPSRYGLVDVNIETPQKTSSTTSTATPETTPDEAISAAHDLAAHTSINIALQTAIKK